MQECKKFIICMKINSIFYFKYLVYVVLSYFNIRLSTLNAR